MLAQNLGLLALTARLHRPLLHPRRRPRRSPRRRVAARPRTAPAPVHRALAPDPRRDRLPPLQPQSADLLYNIISRRHETAFDRHHHEFALQAVGHRLSPALPASRRSSTASSSTATHRHRRRLLARQARLDPDRPPPKPSRSRRKRSWSGGRSITTETSDRQHAEARPQPDTTQSPEPTDIRGRTCQTARVTRRPAHPPRWAAGIEPLEQVPRDAERFSLQVRHGATVTFSLSSDRPHKFRWRCSACTSPCVHAGAAFSVVLEDKVTLGLAEPPPDVDTGLLDLVERAIAERTERARAEKMSLRAADSTRPWTDYTLTSAGSGRSYRVALRGWQSGDSYCSCPDFRKNTLGTCKHILHVLEKVRRRFPA